MPKSQGRTAVALFIFVMLVVLGAGLAAAQTAQPAQTSQATAVQPTVEPNPVPLWLGGIAEVCFNSFNGCQPEAPGPCCWRCPGGSPAWICSSTPTTASACKSLCQTRCGTTCGWI